MCPPIVHNKDSYLRVKQRTSSGKYISGTFEANMGKLSVSVYSQSFSRCGPFITPPGTHSYNLPYLCNVWARRHDPGLVWKVFLMGVW